MSGFRLRVKGLFFGYDETHGLDLVSIDTVLRLHISESQELEDTLFGRHVRNRANIWPNRCKGVLVQGISHLKRMLSKCDIELVRTREVQERIRVLVVWRHQKVQSTGFAVWEATDGHTFVLA